MIVRFGERKQCVLFFQQVVLVRDPFRSSVHLITPRIDKLFSPSVQFLHGRERSSLYQLLFEVVERFFDFLSEYSDKRFYPQFFIIRTF